MMMMMMTICYDVIDNSKYNETDYNDEAHNDDDIESKMDNPKDEYEENMATKNVSLEKDLYLVGTLKGSYLRSCRIRSELTVGS